MQKETRLFGSKIREIEEEMKSDGRGWRKTEGEDIQAAAKGAESEDAIEQEWSKEKRETQFFRHE